MSICQAFKIPTLSNDFLDEAHLISNIPNTRFTHIDRFLYSHTQFITHEIPFTIVHIIRPIKPSNLRPKGSRVYCLSLPLSRYFSVLPGLLPRPVPIHHQVFAEPLQQNRQFDLDTPSATCYMSLDQYTIPFDSKRSPLLKSKFNVDQRKGNVEASRPLVVLHNGIPIFCNFVACQCRSGWFVSRRYFRIMHIV